MILATDTWPGEELKDKSPQFLRKNPKNPPPYIFHIKNLKIYPRNFSGYNPDSQLLSVSIEISLIR